MPNDYALPDDPDPEGNSLNYSERMEYWNEFIPAQEWLTEEEAVGSDRPVES